LGWTNILEQNNKFMEELIQGSVTKDHNCKWWFNVHEGKRMNESFPVINTDFNGLKHGKLYLGLPEVVTDALSSERFERIRIYHDV
jgi:hypothetical protein